MIHTDPHIKTLSTEFASLLRTRAFGRHMRFFESTGSTNSCAMEWAEAGAPEGALVFAEHQTDGRGRHGRRWQAKPFMNLLISIVLRPTLSPMQLGLITIVASLAIAETIDELVTPVLTKIKWPNDVLLDGRKCCGMLLESAISHRRDTSIPVVLGIGINVNQTCFSEDIATGTTSLLLETGRHIPRMELLAQLLLRLEGYYEMLSQDCNTTILDAYQKKLAFMGQMTSLKFIGKETAIEGIILGVSKRGALMLQTANGIKEFHAGEVTSRRQANYIVSTSAGGNPSGP